MEKKRRARINQSLEELKQLILDANKEVSITVEILLVNKCLWKVSIILISLLGKQTNLM